MNKINRHISAPPWKYPGKCTKKFVFIFLFYMGLLHPMLSNAAPNPVALSVWVNEAIITSYTLDYEHLLQQEKELAKYFTSEGWIGYSQAFQASNLPQKIQANSYVVTAVATMPPTLKSVNQNEWEATMPILVLWKNPAYQQKQELNVIVRFIASTSQGVRGYAIVSLKSIPMAAPCRCAKAEQTVSIG